MIRHMLSAVAAAVLALGAGAASAQDIDFGSELNRTWWNGMTPNELQMLAAEAGAIYTSVSDDGQLVTSRIEWPDIGAVQALQGSCNWTNGAAGRDDNCTELLLIYEADLPSDMDAFLDNEPIWLSSSIGDRGELRLYRYDIYQFGTTRGRVLAELMLFHENVGRALQLIDQIDGN